MEMLVFPVRYPVRVPVAYLGWFGLQGQDSEGARLFSLGPPHVRQEEASQYLLHSTPLMLGSMHPACAHL